MKDIEREYSEEFDKRRKSRVYVSYYKYGAAKDNAGSGEPIQCVIEAAVGGAENDT